ncbi:MAG: universal stress protein [Thermodesulfobacteriota bacterium]
MKIMVCTDGSEYGNKAVQYAARFADNYGIDLTILHVIEDTITQDELPTFPGFKPRREKAEQILSQAKQLAGEVSKKVTCHERMALGPITSEIVRIAEVEDFDGIVVGTKGVRGLKRMLVGSIARQVIRHAHCPVTVVR